MAHVPIEIVDDYEHPDSSLEYVLENVLGEQQFDLDSVELHALQEAYNSLLLNPCQCASLSSSCIVDCCHGGNYTQNVDAALVLNPQKETTLIYECSAQCACRSDTCLNRLVQHGPRKHLQINDSQVFKSKGLFTRSSIPKGAFICEYAGELITPGEAQRRLAINASNKLMNYIFCLNEMALEHATVIQRTIVDPSWRGNIGRYLNHSCMPNCELFSVRVDCPVPKIAIFAKREIAVGEELTFHYGGDAHTPQSAHSTSSGTPCLCRAENCAKYLPSIVF